MASPSAVSFATPLTYASQKTQPIATDIFKPLPVRPSRASTATKSLARFQVKSSLKEKAVSGVTAAALAASIMTPQAAGAAESSISPSLQNFLGSILAGGVVLGAIIVAVAAIATFDPVKRT